MYWISVRAHVLVVGILTLLGLATGAALQWEHLGPDAALSASTYERAHTIHGLALWGSALPLATGVVSAVTLPRALGLRALNGWWLVPVSVTAWALGMALLLSLRPSPWSLGLVVVGLDCLALAVLGTLVSHRARLRNAPLLAAGVGGAALLQLIASAQVMLRLVGPSLGVGALGSGLANLLPLGIPVTMGLAAHMMERHVDRPLPRRKVVGAAIVIPALMPWLPDSDPIGITASLSVVVFTVALLRHLRKSSQRLHVHAIGPIVLALCVALRTMTHAHMRGSWAEPFLPQTYMMLAPVHASWLALFLGLVLAVSSEPTLLRGRQPRPALLRIGALMLAVGFGVGSWMMLVVGSQGMPRRYHMYLPQFTTSFQTMGVFAAVGLIGAALIGAAFAGARQLNSATD